MQHIYNLIFYITIMLTAVLLDACGTKTTEIKATLETVSLGDIGVEETATKKIHHKEQR